MHATLHILVHGVGGGGMVLHVVVELEPEVHRRDEDTIESIDDVIAKKV